MPRLAGALATCLALALPHGSCSSGNAAPPAPPGQAPAAAAPRPPARDTSSVRYGHLHPDGSLWFGTNDAGVYRYDGASFRNYRQGDGLVSDRVDAITHDTAGNLWFGTDRGLCRFDGASFTTVAIPWDGNADLWGPGLSANLVISLLCDSRGRIWCGTWGNGAHRFDPTKPLESGRYEFDSFLQDEGSTYDDGEHRNVVQSIVEDAAGNVWLTSMSHGGVQRFDGQRFAHWSIADGMGDDMVFSACVAHDGAVWFGMLGNRGSGLVRFDGSSFQRFDVASGLSANNVVDICEDRNGTLWLASQRGVLCQLTRGAAADAAPTIRPFVVDGASFNRVMFVTEDASGAIWFGGGNRRLYRYGEGALTDLSGQL